MKLLDEAELAKLNNQERYSYEMSLKRFRDYHNTIDYSYVKGKTEGKIEVSEEIITQMLKKGYSPETISDVTGISLNLVLEIQKKLDV